MNKKNLASATAPEKQQTTVELTINDYKAAAFDIQNEIARLQNAHQQIMKIIQEKMTAATKQEAEIVPAESV